MTQIQTTVVAPGDRRSMWRLPDDQLIGLLIPTIVQQMGLTEEINWQLVPAKTGKPLAEDATLARVRIPPDAVLNLEPIRNELLKMFLKKLYEEAESKIKDNLWDKALEKLDELHRYDPRYPDPRGLRRLAELGLAPSAIPAAGISWGLVLGGLAVVGVLAVGATLAVGGVIGVGLLISRSGQQSTTAPGGSVQPHTGDVQVTLEWYTTADLDLHVVDPDGAEVYFGNRQVASGGELDVDANYPCENATSSPLENVYWPWGGAPPGEYQVFVHYFGECLGEGPLNYRVIVRVDGNVVDDHPGSMSPGESVPVTTFNR
jgi:hypothetical protein